MSRPEQPADSFRNITAAALRAVAGETPDHIDVSYGPAPASLIAGESRVIAAPANRKTARLPHAGVVLDDAAKSELRGAADAAALYLRHHDAARHAKLAPVEAKSKGVFDLLEQVRCDMIGAKSMPGIAGNLLAALDVQAKKKGYGNPDRPVPVPLEDGLFTLAYEAMAGRKLGPHADAAAAQWRDFFDRHDAQGKWQSLLDAVDDQQAFAAASYKLIRALDLNPGRDDPEPTPDADQTPQQGQGQGQEQVAGEGGEGDENGEAQAQSETQSEGDGAEKQDGAAEGDMGDELPDPSDTMGDKPAGSNTRDNAGPPGRDLHYKVYTSRFDETITATELVKPDELARLRATLDQQLMPLQAIIGRLANRLLRKLMAQQQRSWLFDVEEGLLDPARLARVVTTPGSPLSFRQEKDTDFRDTVVTLLIDNSGSMRGRPITIAALTSDIIAKALERCGIKVEILGFTTAAWKGGQSRDQWMADQRPVNPGRLNDIRHIVYKAADQPLRRARANMGLMLKEGILKENIDGEALLWAHDRLARRPEKRRIMMVISDGAPVDDSTLSANGSGYLEEDLRRIVNWIEEKKAVELVAIGIGHDVSRYYAHAITIREVEDLARTVADQLADMFVG